MLCRDCQRWWTIYIKRQAYLLKIFIKKERSAYMLRYKCEKRGFFYYDVMQTMGSLERLRKQVWILFGKTIIDFYHSIHHI